MAESVLTVRDLNRALLARQMLLQRQAIAPYDAVRRLLALQAQIPRAPFLGLWARLEEVTREQVLSLIHTRELVRSTFVRGTLHLTTAADFLAWRGLLRTAPDLQLPGDKGRTKVADLAPILDLARDHFLQEPQDFESFREKLEALGYDKVRPLAYAARILLPLVQAADDTPFGHAPGGRFLMSKAWLGRDPDPDPKTAHFLVQYLLAFGPATPADFATFAGVQGAAAHFEALGDQLVTVRDERGRKLYDLPDAPRPGGDTPAPPRLVPDYDAVVLGHQDRSRIMSPETWARLANRNLQVPPLVLIDGFVAGRWKLERKGRRAQAAITLFRPAPAKVRAALEGEALSAIAFAEPDAAAEVAFT